MQLVIALFVDNDRFRAAGRGAGRQLADPKETVVMFEATDGLTQEAAFQ